VELFVYIAVVFLQSMPVFSVDEWYRAVLWGNAMRIKKTDTSILKDINIWAWSGDLACRRLERALQRNTMAGNGVDPYSWLELNFRTAKHR
jgi:hypothetical protein